MKHGHFIFERILIIISCVLGASILINSNATILPLLWMIVLGGLQIIHSLIIAFEKWSNLSLRNAICIYWLLAVTDLALLFFTPNSFSSSSFIYPILFPVLPLCLAVYITGICWYFSEKRITQ